MSTFVKGGGGGSEKVTIDDVKVLTDSYVKRSKQVYAGSAAILELSHETKVQTITITFNTGDAVGISEVQILAKG